METCRNPTLCFMTFDEFLSSGAVSRPHLMLVGSPVGHSLSPLMHNEAAREHGLDLRYHAVEVEERDFGRLLSHFRSPSFRGANVTIPYKKRAASAVDRLREEGSVLNAVNTVVVEGDRLEGFNTDVHGFMEPLRALRIRLEGGAGVIFGSGGAARSACLGLRNLGVRELTLVSREPSRRGLPDGMSDIEIVGYGEWRTRAGDARIFVNATPLGMHPDTGRSPLKPDEYPLLEEKIAYDIVYRPLKTTFLKNAKRAGARTIGGIEMFIHQGGRSFELWTGRAFPTEQIRQKLHEYLNE